MSLDDAVQEPEDAPPAQGTWIEIDQGRLEGNLQALQREFDPARLCFVIKADAYGHGIAAVVPIAEGAGVRDFAVFSAHEAWHALGASDGQSRIQVMGHVEPENMLWVARCGLEPWVNDDADWQATMQGARDAARNRSDCLPLRVHVEVETGMHRTGLEPDSAVDVICAAADMDEIEVVGLCTHLAGAEDRRNEARVQAQMEVFESVCDQVRSAGCAVPARHVSSSSAALLDERFRMEMVRSGIAGYGLWPTPEVRAGYRVRDEARPLRLRRAMSWRTRIMAVKHVPEGTFVGYGQAHRTNRDTTLAILPVGYGDGFTRGLSNAGQVLIHGTPCPIVGQVNMNMVQVDVGHLPSAGPGDEVVLIGHQGDEEITVHSFAEGQHLLNYELMARISRDIPRRVTGERGPDLTFIRGLDVEIEETGEGPIRASDHPGRPPNSSQSH